VYVDMESKVKVARATRDIKFSLTHEGTHGLTTTDIVVDETQPLLSNNHYNNASSEHLSVCMDAVWQEKEKQQTQHEGTGSCRGFDICSIDASCVDSDKQSWDRQQGPTSTITG
jgi:hypothetical protein